MNAPEGRAFVPAGVGRLRFTDLGGTPAWVTCRLLSVEGDTALLDLRLWDEDGQLVLEATEFALTALTRADAALFETRWQPRSDAQEAVAGAAGCSSPTGPEWLPRSRSGWPPPRHRI